MATDSDKWAVGFDLGGTNLRAGLVSSSGELKFRASCPTNPARGSDAVIQDMVSVIRDILSQASSSIVGVGVAAPGPLDPKSGIIINSPNLNWGDVHLKKILGKELDTEITLDNDSQMTAFGERWKGAGLGSDHLVLLTLGTGVGGGVILNGCVYRGGSGSAGHIGHYILDPEGPICGCGARGCLEAYASGPNIVRRAKEAISHGNSTSLKNILVEDRAGLTPLKIFEAAQQGDALAIDILAETGRYIGQVLASLLPILDPELIVVSGQVAFAGDFILDPARKRMAELVHIRPQVPIVQGALGDDGGIIGAAGVVFFDAGLIS